MLKRPYQKRALIRSLLGILFLTAITSLASSSPTYANDGTVQTTYFGPIQDPGEGCGVYMILNFAMQILSFGVVIAAAIGITISGITYMSAASNANQVVKAKRRIYEIVIGLAAYAVMWTFINFLLPGGLMNTVCETGTESDSLWTEASDVVNFKLKTKSKFNKKASNGNNSKYASAAPTENAKKLISAAEYVAELFEKNGVIRENGKQIRSIKSAKKKKGGQSSCCHYIALAAQYAGLMKDGKLFCTSKGAIIEGRNNLSSKYFQIIPTNSTPKELYSKKKLKPGDIVGLKNTTHTALYVGGKFHSYDGGRTKTTTGKMRGKYVAKKMLNSKLNSNDKIGIIIRPK